MAGLGIIGSLVLAKAYSGVFTYVIAGTMGLLSLSLVLREVKREQDILKVLTEQLVDAMEWREASEDPEVGDHASTMGLWKGARVWLDSRISGVRVRTTSSRWPRSLVILPERSPGTAIGDRGFDRLFSVRGEESDRRASLTPAIRAHLIALGTIAKCTLHNQTLEVVVTKPNQSTRALDACVELIESLPEVSADQLRRVFDATRVETRASIRADGYRWLIEQSWHPAEVYKAAGADTDAEISAWARDHLPYTEGAFR